MTMSSWRSRSRKVGSGADAVKEWGKINNIAFDDIQ
jgi:hypothetical protein